MNLRRLLLIFRALEDASVDYVVVGSLAMSLQGRLVLTECLQIAIAPDAQNVAHARRAISSAWSDASVIARLDDGVFRVLPHDTPFFLDVRMQAMTGSETVTRSGVNIQVARDRDASSMRCDEWSRPGFSIRQRLDALHSLSAELLPGRAPRGVRKYRSIEDAKAVRDQWGQKRVDCIRKEIDADERIVS